MKKAIILLLLICGLFLYGCNDEDIKKENIDNENRNESILVETWEIKTPYCVLKLPKEYEGKIQGIVSSEDPYVIEFETVDKNNKLFILHFGEVANELIGTLPLDKGNIVLYADFLEIDSNINEYVQLISYQASINTIINNLSKDYGLLVDEIVLDDREEVFEIDTDIVTLHYPSKWKSLVDIENEGDVVKFTSNGVRLFDIYLKECNGDLLGFYKDAPVYIVSYSFNYGNLSDEEYNNLCAMQQDVNVIINHLLEDKNFVK